VIAIDASMQIQQIFVSMGMMHAQTTDLEHTNVSPLNGLLSRSMRLIAKGIRLIYVFDGQIPEMRRDELPEMEEERQPLQSAIENANEEEIDRLNRRAIPVDPIHAQEFRLLLEHMGIPHIEAPGKAE
jgi:flap endonuclease-1